MKDGNVKEFLDHAIYEKVAVEYGGYKYFFYGMRKDVNTGLYTFVVERFRLDCEEDAFQEPYMINQLQQKKNVRSNFFRRQ